MAPTKRRTSYDLGLFQLSALVALRWLVGWHFLYEGVAKLVNPQWSAAGYLQQSQGWFSERFQDLAANQAALPLVDALNEWGLVAIGAALLLGVFVRTAAGAGVLLLLLYYVAAPPLPGLEYAMPAEGSYLIVNKVLVEAAAVLVILGFPTSDRIGLDRLLRLRGGGAAPPATATATEGGP